MKFLKKRLPALLLALIIAVMPLSLAVPVSADSGVLSEPGTFLSGSADTVLGHVDVNFTAPVLYENSICYISVFEELVLITWPDDFYLWVSLQNADISSDIPAYTLTLYPFLDETLTLVAYEIPVDIDRIGSSLDVEFTEDDRCDITCSHTSQYRQVALFPFSTEQPSLSVPFYMMTYHDAPDVTIPSVFSGVASWFAGAIRSATSMFWTAEGGLTVLGVLAVASLAIAFIILLIYLLAGWLKFK